MMPSRSTSSSTFRRSMFFLSPAIAIIVLTAAGPTLIDAAADDDPKPKTTDTRVYDIRDLLVQIPNFTGAPAFDTVGTPPDSPVAVSSIFESDHGASELSREGMIEQIVNVIQDTVGEQESWAAYGGVVSSLREMNGNLIIKAPLTYHKQIEELLSQLRMTRTKQVATDAMFIRIKTVTLEKFKKEHSDSSPILSEKAAEQLASMATAKDSDIQIIGAARLLAFNGQRVHAWGLEDQFVPTDKEIKFNERAKESAQSDDSTSSKADANDTAKSQVKKTNSTLIRSGIVFDVEHTLTNDTKHVIMTLRCNAAPARIDGKQQVDGNGSRHCQFNTSCRVPDKGGVILGVVSHAIKNDKPSGDSEVVLFLRVRVVQSK